MKFQHQGLDFEIPDEWWAEAEMPHFRPMSRAYRVAQADADNPTFAEIAVVDIEDVGPLRRSVGIFKDSAEEGGAKHRVMRLLEGFRNGDAIPAVQVIMTDAAQPRYRLTHGANRFYCSVAAGFTHVPTTQGYEYGT